MEKLHRAAAAALTAVESIAFGLAQMGSMGTVEPRSNVSQRSDIDALHSDWDRVGADLSRSIEAVRELEKAR